MDIGDEDSKRNRPFIEQLQEEDRKEAERRKKEQEKNEGKTEDTEKKAKPKK
jgi:hypothetical protein